MKQPWKDSEREYLEANYRKIPLEDIAKTLGKSRTAVYLFCHRHGLDTTAAPVRNLLIEILEKRLPDYRLFHPTREFYEQVGISQKRFWQILKGKSPITDLEYRVVATYFNVTLEEAFEMRQLSLFPTEEINQ